MTFTELSEIWLQNKKIEIKPGTYENYCYLVRKIIEVNIGEIQTKKLNQKTLDIFFYNLQTIKRQQTNKILCKKLILKTFAITKEIISLGQKQKVIKKFAPIFKNIKAVEENESKIKFFEEDECKKIINFCLNENTDTFYSIGILFGLFQGLRIGEICGLRWEDIDFNHKKISINRTVRCSVNPETNKEEWIIGTPKTKTSNRTIPLNNAIYLQLINLQKIRPYTGFIIRNTITEKETDSNLPCRPDMLRKTFYKYLEKLQIPHKNFHCLRHTFASTAIRKGVSPKTVSEILGHSDVKITLNLYVHPNEEEKVNCVNIFDL